jgi:hypothetical protein
MVQGGYAKKILCVAWDAEAITRILEKIAA